MAITAHLSFHHVERIKTKLKEHDGTRWRCIEFLDELGEPVLELSVFADEDRELSIEEVPK